MLPLKEMLNVQNLMKDEMKYGTANIFGLIAYSERNPYIVKVLRDDDFWRSLNARTKGWILYAIKPDSRYYCGGNADFINDNLRIAPEEYPQLVILSIGTDGDMKQRNYPIDDSSVDNAYKSIENNIGIITGAVEKIHPEYKLSTNVNREVIAALDAELAKSQWKKVSKSLLDFVLFIRNLL